MLEPKFLLDADMPRSSVEVVRALGFDIKDVRDVGLRQAKDVEIIIYALDTGRIIITRDLDYGEVLRYPNHPGAIILRLPSEYTAKELNGVLEEFLNSVNKEIIQNQQQLWRLGDIEGALWIPLLNS